MFFRKKDCECIECTTPSIEEAHQPMRFVVAMILAIIVGSLYLKYF